MEKRIAHVGVGQEFRMVGGYYGEGDRIDSWLGSCTNTNKSGIEGGEEGNQGKQKQR